MLTSLWDLLNAKGGRCCHRRHRLRLHRRRRRRLSPWHLRESAPEYRAGSSTCTAAFLESPSLKLSSETRSARWGRSCGLVNRVAQDGAGRFRSSTLKGSEGGLGRAAGQRSAGPGEVRTPEGSGVFRNTQTATATPTDVSGAATRTCVCACVTEDTHTHTSQR